MLGARYLRQVQAAWPAALLRGAAAVDAGPDAYTTLLSPSLVRIIAPTDVDGETGLPRVVGPRDSGTVLQWAAPGQQILPAVLQPSRATR
jgi:hypothetical protein